MLSSSSIPHALLKYTISKTPYHTSPQQSHHHAPPWHLILILSCSTTIIAMHNKETRGLIVHILYYIYNNCMAPLMPSTFLLGQSHCDRSVHYKRYILGVLFVILCFFSHAQYDHLIYCGDHDVGSHHLNHHNGKCGHANAENGVHWYRS